MEKKTKYLLSLETLSSLVKESSSNDDLSARLDMLSRLLHAHTVLCLFQSADAEAKEKISFQKFYDVDFSYWSNSKNWKINEVLSFDDEEMTERYLLQNWTPATPVLSSSDFNNIAGTLPTPPASIEFDDANGRDSMRQILSNLSGPYFSSGYLRYALFSIIQQICDTLRSLQRSLRTQRSEADYRHFHDDLWLRYSTAHIQDLSEEYENIKSHRLGEITSDWLQEKLQDELLRLYNSPFFTCLMQAVSYIESNKTPILYDLNEIEKRMVKKFYFVLTQLGAVQDRHIDFSGCGIALGRFICNFQDQLSPSSHESFFRFRIMSTLIQSDMDTLPSLPVATNKKSKSTPQVDKTYMTFATHGISMGNITLMFQHLMDIGWIAKSTSADEFSKLFSGQSCVCKITWTGGGKGNLKYLFQILIDQQKLTIPQGFDLVPILESHFVDKNGIYLSGLNSGKESSKAPKIAQECLTKLNLRFTSSDD